MVKNMKYILTIITILIVSLGFYFLVALGAVDFATKCFGFAFSWKYVWFVWFILSFVTPFFKGNSGGDKNA